MVVQLPQDGDTAPGGFIAEKFKYEFGGEVKVYFTGCNIMTAEIQQTASQPGEPLGLGIDAGNHLPDKFRYILFAHNHLRSRDND